MIICKHYGLGLESILCIILSGYWGTRNQFTQPPPWARYKISEDTGVKLVENRPVFQLWATWSRHTCTSANHYTHDVCKGGVVSGIPWDIPSSSTEPQWKLMDISRVCIFLYWTRTQSDDNYRRVLCIPTSQSPTRGQSLILLFSILTNPGKDLVPNS